MPSLSSVSLRDKSGNAVPHTESQTSDFNFTETASVGHSVSQLEFDIEGAGWFHGWFGHREVSNINWDNLNWEACCLFQDGLNQITFTHHPFRGDPALNSIGWGPGNTYTFDITRAPAFTAPTNIAAPSISGSSSIGSTLTASPGSWTGNNHSFTYMWKRSPTLNGSYVDIGTNSSTYELDSADAGTFIKVYVVATANGLSSSAIGSSAVTVQALATTTTRAPTTTRPPTTIPPVSDDVGSGEGGASSGSTTESLAPTPSNPVTTTTSTNDTEAPTTTAEIPETSTTTTTIPADINAPEVPDVEIGSAVATIDGEEVAIDVERNDDSVILRAGDVVWELGATSPDGTRIQLDEIGNLVLSPGDRIAVNLEGFGSSTPVEVWLFSIPVKVKDLIADESGSTFGDFAIPQGIDGGAHRLVVTGNSANDHEVVIAFGVAIDTTGNSGSSMRILIGVFAAVIVILVTVLVGGLRRRLRRDA
jgi:hypothetical protein